LSDSDRIWESEGYKFVKYSCNQGEEVMKMSYSSMVFLGILLMALLFSGCSSAPSDEDIQTAIAKTQIAQITNTPIFTVTPITTLTPTADTTRQILINQVVNLLNRHTTDSDRKSVV
jgi:PBP1b-binding outer membrane lipoprotein LpoB